MKEKSTPAEALQRENATGCGRFQVQTGGSAFRSGGLKQKVGTHGWRPLWRMVSWIPIERGRISPSRVELLQRYISQVAPE